ncbi:MAG: dynamin family protein, partial [Cyanobacteria bacterium P01_D01_bin.56]
MQQAQKQEGSLREHKDCVKRTIEKLEQVIERSGKESGIHVANELEVLQNIKQQIDRESFYVSVYGDYNSGKTTLVNALIGPLQDDTKPLLPTGEMSTTAVPTSIRYGETLTVTACNFDGKATDWPLEDFQEKGRINIKDPQAANEYLRDIQKFNLVYPSKFLDETNMVLTDFPGTTDTQALDDTTRE